MILYMCIIIERKQKIKISPTVIVSSTDSNMSWYFNILNILKMRMIRSILTNDVAEDPDIQLQNRKSIRYPATQQKKVSGIQL